MLRRQPSGDAILKLNSFSDNFEKIYRKPSVVQSVSSKAPEFDPVTLL